MSKERGQEKVAKSLSELENILETLGTQMVDVTYQLTAVGVKFEVVICDF
jgi:hypothetical protein